ncbi:MazG-like family protein [Catellatospora sp. NEAU-YM18]|nr:MazG-like family protein [Catellatospora tritici]
MRILKVTEEAGEAARAWIGVTGQNPRKGVTHTPREVADELADVALSALVAIESLGFDPAQVLSACAAKVLDRLPR